MYIFHSEISRIGMCTFRLATGLQVQVTELDIGISDTQTEEDLARHYSDIMKLLISKQKNHDKTVNARGITGVTVWGRYDTISWRKPTSCLLFGESLEDPKPAFYSFLRGCDKIIAITTVL